MKGNQEPLAALNPPMNSSAEDFTVQIQGE